MTFTKEDKNKIREAAEKCAHAILQNGDLDTAVQTLAMIDRRDDGVSSSIFQMDLERVLYDILGSRSAARSIMRIFNESVREYYSTRVDPRPKAGRSSQSDSTIDEALSAVGSSKDAISDYVVSLVMDTHNEFYWTLHAVRLLNHIDEVLIYASDVNAFEFQKKMTDYLDELVSNQVISVDQYMRIYNLVETAKIAIKNYDTLVEGRKDQGVKLMAREDLHPTDHLREKMKERDVSWGEIIDVVNHYENAYGPDEKGRMVFQKGTLSVVADGEGAIITVLLRRSKNWTDEEMKIIRENVEELRSESQRPVHRTTNPKRDPKPKSYYKRKKRQKKDKS